MYECLRSQQQTLFDLWNRMRSLETALRTNQDFCELLLAAERALENEDTLREHVAKLAEFDTLIQELRGIPGSEN